MTKWPANMEKLRYYVACVTTMVTGAKCYICFTNNNNVVDGKFKCVHCGNVNRVRLPWPSE